MDERIEVRFGDAAYVASPLNLRAVKALLPRVRAMAAADTDPLEALALATDVIVAAVTRIHPDFTADLVDQHLSMPEALEMSQRILALSGFVAGNPMATAQPSPSSGESSTAS